MLIVVVGVRIDVLGIEVQIPRVVAIVRRTRPVVAVQATIVRDGAPPFAGVEERWMEYSYNAHNKSIRDEPAYDPYNPRTIGMLLL